MGIRIAGLPHGLNQKFTRAVAVSGAGSKAQLLLSLIRRFVREQEEKFGDLFDALTAEEQQIYDVISVGAAEKEQIAEESLIPLARVQVLLDDMVSRKILEIRKKGGKTDGARGARIDLYFVPEK